MKNLLSIDNLSVCYEDGVPVLHGVSLSLGENEVLGLIGESGCGKSTLLRLIAGRLCPVPGHEARAGAFPGRIGGWMK